jgi:hypothetical protein
LTRIDADYLNNKGAKQTKGLTTDGTDGTDEGGAGRDDFEQHTNRLEGFNRHNKNSEFLVDRTRGFWSNR